MSKGANLPFDIPTPEEAIQIARDVSSGQTRSYVRAAMLLANYVQQCIACKIEGRRHDTILSKYHTCKL